jgi:CubicO group peptidase (beta-lactamase class C family)
MKAALVNILTISLLASGCEMYESSARFTYQYPDSLSDGFEVASLEDVNLNERLIEEAVNKIYSGRYPEVHSMLIYKDGRLVLDEYFRGHKYQWEAPYHHGEWVTWDRDMLHDLMSSSKSITSCLTGIAIEKGFIESVHQSIFDFLPDHQRFRNSGKEKITIEHLLTMTSGLDWKEWSAPYSSTENPNIGIWFQEEDPVSFILEKPLVSEPGTSFNYNTGHMHLLGEIIRNASGMNIDQFSRKYLFDPLKVDTLSWSQQFPNGEYDGNSLLLTPRAMMKFGVICLNNGNWNGNRIVSEEWVEKSTTAYGNNKGINIPEEPSGKLGYGYNWWTKVYSVQGTLVHMYTASGFGGQHIMVLPEVGTVVVFTGGNYLSRKPPFKILEKYIIPAIR